MRKKSVLEASGVCVVDESYCYVIFDNLNAVAKIDLSFEPKKSNHLFSVLNVGTGFEDITYDPKDEKFYLIIESLRDADGVFRGLVSEYDKNFLFLNCTKLNPAFERKNKGFEGVGHFRRDGGEYLVGLWEGADSKKGTRGNGCIYLFPKTRNEKWSEHFSLQLPKSARFKDFAAIARRDNRVAVISQESRRLWIGEINENQDGFSVGAGQVYRFPKKSYCNVEGVSWLSDDLLVMVSDRRKKKQKDVCKCKDQSIHIFRVPAQD